MKNNRLIFYPRIFIFFIQFVISFCSSKPDSPENISKFGNSLVWTKYLNEEMFNSIKFKDQKNQILFININHTLDSMSRELISLSGGFHPDTLFRFINPCKKSRKSKIIFNSRKERLINSIFQLYEINGKRNNLNKIKNLFYITFIKYPGKDNPVFSDPYFENYCLLGMAMDIESMRNEFLFRCLMEKDLIK